MIDPMAGKFKALIAALVILIVALAGALYVVVRGFDQSPSSAQFSVSMAGNSAHDGAASDVPPAALFDKALTDLETEYYKPFEPQTPFRGEAQALTKYLQSNHVAHPVLPTEIASGDPQADAQRLA